MSPRSPYALEHLNPDAFLALRLEETTAPGRRDFLCEYANPAAEALLEAARRHSGLPPPGPVLRPPPGSNLPLRPTPLELPAVDPSVLRSAADEDAPPLPIDEEPLPLHDMDG